MGIAGLKRQEYVEEMEENGHECLQPEVIEESYRSVDDEIEKIMMCQRILYSSSSLKRILGLKR